MIDSERYISKSNLMEKKNFQTKNTLFAISENVSHSQIASSPFLRDDNKIPNFTPPQIEEKEKSNSSLSTTGESDANEVIF